MTSIPNSGESAQAAARHALSVARAIQADAPQTLSTLDQILERVDRIEALLRRLARAESPAGEGPDDPEDCRQKRCDYYVGYLGQGPAEMSHPAYHALEQAFLRLSGQADTWYENHRSGTYPSNALLRSYERRLRA